MAAPEDFLNQALIEINWRGRPIGWIYEGSPQARAGLEIYRPTRDELLQERDWPFALREAALVLVSGQAPGPWVNEYTYPSDCLRIRGIRPGPLFPTAPIRELDPQPILWRTYNDTRPATPIRAILCDGTASPVVIYTGRITDPTTWEPEFVDQFRRRLAMRLAFKLADANMQRTRLAIAADPERVTDMMPPAPATAMAMPPAPAAEQRG